MPEQNITISADRYVELIRAEKTAQMLLDIIKEKNEQYCGIDYSEVKLMHTLFCGYVGEEE
jgi:hypothetical protein